MITNTDPIFRPSASVIIAARVPNVAAAEGDYDYRLLLFKRTEHTAFAMDHCVFPGGVFEVEADEAASWLQYFREFGVTEKQLAQLHGKGNSENTRPHPLLTSGRNFSRDISLRICAIRETFEEVGLLLCRDHNSLTDEVVTSGHFREDFDRFYWQHRVHKNPAEFLKLCQHLSVIPDLWSLHEWSVWRSPIVSPKKYDTIIYFVALPEQPTLVLERSEVEMEMWHRPPTFLQLYSQRSIWLPPIQYYELSRLKHAHNWGQLLQFAKERQNRGSTLLWPAYYSCDDGRVGTLPGDDFYPTDPFAHKGFVVVPQTVEQFGQKAKRLHRYICFDFYDVRVELNIPPLDGHLSPVKENSSKSKL